MSRYRIVSDSTSGHCCFEYTIIDTNKPTMIHGKHYQGIDGELQYDPVCECFEKDDADKIALALNNNEERL